MSYPVVYPRTCGILCCKFVAFSNMCLHEKAAARLHSCTCVSRYPESHHYRAQCQKYRIIIIAHIVKPSAASQRESIHGRGIELVSRMTSVESRVRVCTWLCFHHEQYRDHDELPYRILSRCQYSDIWNWAFMIIS